MVYEAFRVNGGPTQHSSNQNPVTVDVLAAGFIFAFCMLGFSFFLIAPGFPGIKRLYFLIRVVVSLFIGSAILLGVLGQDWEISEIETKTPYKVFSNTEINATIGAKIGLGAVNITLKGNPINQLVDQTHLQENNTYWMEHIDYNERFHWAWRQGRFGFGPYAGRINREFRDAQYKGLPIPILWVAEYFTLDGELIRWGRSFRTAGWYTWQVLWTAFPLWIIANVLSAMVLAYCGFAFILTGSCMLTSIIIYSTIRWGYQPLAIPFEDSVMEFTYGPSYWLTVTGGSVSVVYGLIIVGMDHKYPRLISDFFGVDVLQDPEEFFHKEAPDEENHQAPPHTTRGGVARRVRHRATHNKLSRKLARSSRRKPKATVTTSHATNGFDSLETGHMPNMDESDENVYENEDTIDDNVYEDVRHAPMTSTI